MRDSISIGLIFLLYFLGVGLAIGIPVVIITPCIITVLREILDRLDSKR